MSTWADKLKVRTDPALRTVLRRWLELEQEPQTRLEALGVAAEVRRLAYEVLDQRVPEARSFHHTCAEIAAAVGVTRRPAHRRWPHLDPLVDGSGHTASISEPGLSEAEVSCHQGHPMMAARLI